MLDTFFYAILVFGLVSAVGVMLALGNGDRAHGEFGWARCPSCGHNVHGEYLAACPVCRWRRKRFTPQNLARQTIAAAEKPETSCDAAGDVTPPRTRHDVAGLLGMRLPQSLHPGITKSTMGDGAADHYP